MYRLSKHIDWVHPSYRDLVIEELSRDKPLRKTFLENMGLHGIRLTISDTGGAQGKRIFPLLKQKEDWQILHDRCKIMAIELSQPQINALFTSLLTALTQAKKSEVSYFKKIIKDLCEIVKRRWDEKNEMLSLYTVQTFARASMTNKPLSPMPDLEPTLLSAIDDFETSTNRLSMGFMVGTEIEPLQSALKIFDCIRENEPRLLAQHGLSNKIRSELLGLCNSLIRHVEGLNTQRTLDDLTQGKDDLEDLRKLVDYIERSYLSKEIEDSLSDLKSNIDSKVYEISENIRELEDEDEPEEGDSDTAPTEEGERDYFSITKLFEDI